MTNNNTLLLQGPMGPFFKRFALELKQKGMKVVKVNLNAGDWLFFPQGRRYNGDFKDWVAYLDQLVVSEKIDKVFLFGDERPYHRAAIKEVFKPRNIDVYVFEEGYLRPSFVTLEKDGVNGNSLMSKEAIFYKNAVDSSDSEKVEVDRPVVKGQFLSSMLFSVIYGLAKFSGALFYRKYQHHRCLNPSKQGVLWLWGWLFKKPYYHLTEKKCYKYLLASFNKKYFFVPLQVHNDFQISHSPYKDVREFIQEVVVSFAENAPKETVLVFKHHPMDRPYRNYKKFLKRLSDEHCLEGRLFYLHDQHLPTLLHNARATIAINSTVGLSSLHHSVPVLVRGTAVYNIPGLTSQSSLKAFWNNQGKVDKALYKNYRLYLLDTNQGHGSFYRKGFENSITGISWPKGLDLLRVNHTTILTHGPVKPHAIRRNLNKPSVVQIMGSGSE